MSPHVDNLRDATGVARDLLLTELDTGRQVSVLLAVIHARHSSGAPLPLTKRANFLRPPISIFLQVNNVMVSSQPKMALHATGAAGALASWAFSSRACGDGLQDDDDVVTQWAFRWQSGKIYLELFF
ncbi:hypothetical protein PCANC_17441 [Puccinia coronata f. sp. avenae]|uniref:Uncharacterized protein n=1 Tax=Puccinia coronata f. sp. avenae TaxID=200324 RepID=A0A2N5UUZ4_9BASI|nr:hypothetical protein PCANC_17441 [Puccinia coronata f. sp. avenae]